MKKSYNFLLILVLLTLVGVFFVMKPFIMSIFLAFILSTMFYKTNKKLTKKLGNRKSISSLLMCMWIMLILVVPFIIVTLLMISEANSVFGEIQDKNISLDVTYIQNLPITKSLNLEGLLQSETVTKQIAQNAQNLGNNLFSLIKAIYSGVSNFAFILIVCFFALYYFLKDGDLIIKKIMEISPLPTNQEKRIFEKFNTMTVATIKGTLIIAVIQGILMGITFWVTGVKAPTLWGFTTALISIIPLLGTFLVWLPAGIILLVIGNYWQAITILIIGALVISSVDNILRPKLIEEETSLHPLLVFLSTLGGIAFFGPLGFVVGPVLIALLVALLEIYQKENIEC